MCIDTIFAFYGYIDFFFFFLPILTAMLIQFLSMIAWTHAVLGVFYIYIDLHSRSQEYKKASYIYIYIYICMCFMFVFALVQCS